MMYQTETVGTDGTRYENSTQNRASIRETQTVYRGKQTKKKWLETAVSSHFLVAGAEGLEPSARGFGVAVEKLAARITTGVFGGVEPFQTAQYTYHQILMIFW